MSEELNFVDKVVLITGSSGGLGAEMAREFAKRGAQLVITGRNAERVNGVSNECDLLSPNGQTALQVVGDVTVDDDLVNLVDTAIDQFGQIDVLVNNAGAGSFSTIDDPKIIDDLEHMFKLDVRSVVKLTHLAVPHLEKTKGVIINISSVASMKAYAGCAAYCMAKISIDMFTRCMALELGPKGIRVNVVNPTGVRTNFQANTGAGDTFDNLLSHLETINPLRKIPSPQDIADTVLFLASNKCSSITGISVPVDCGNSLT